MSRFSSSNKKKTEVIEDKINLVTFQLGGELYGVEIMEVDQIVKTQPVRSIPNAPHYVEGIFNLRSEIIPVISLHKRFHIKSLKSDEYNEYLGGFLILLVEGNKIGVIIDRVARVVAITKDDVQPPPQMIAGIGTEYISGVVRKAEGGYLIILDIHKLFDPRELQVLTNL